MVEVTDGEGGRMVVHVLCGDVRHAVFQYFSSFETSICKHSETKQSI